MTPSAAPRPGLPTTANKTRYFVTRAERMTEAGAKTTVTIVRTTDTAANPPKRY